MSQQINLFNAGLRHRRELVSATNLVLGVMVVLLGVGLAYLYFEFEVGRLSREAAEVEAELTARQTEFAKLTDQVARIRRSPEIDNQLAQRERQLRGREDVLAALGTGRLGVAVGFSGIMRGLARQKVNGLWLTGIDLPAGGNEVGLHGRMLDPEQLPNYVRGLNRERALQGLSFHTLEVSRPTLAESDAASGTRARYAPYLEFTLRSANQNESGDSPASTARGGA